MMRKTSLALLSAAALVIGGCATTAQPVEVTRFHTNAPSTWPAGTHYSVDVAPLVDAAQMVDSPHASLEWGTYRAAVERQLQLQGFVPVADGAEAPLKLRIGFDRHDRGSSIARRSPVSVGVGGSTGGYRSGVGLGVGFNLGGGGSRSVENFGLFVRLDDNVTGRALWEGRAFTTVSGKSPAAQPSLAAEKLAEALFKGFPGESGRTIVVK